MSEQNILNPNAASLLNPDYPLDGEPEDNTLVFRPKSGELYTRVDAVEAHVFNLSWGMRPMSVADQLRQWFNQYRNDYFTLADYERGRYYTGRFSARPLSKDMGYNNVTVTAKFEEIAAKPMYQYPGHTLPSDDSARWGRDSDFIPTKDSEGNLLVLFTGNWNWYVGSLPACHDGGFYLDKTTNDAVEWVYDGYGFRLWGLKNSIYGIGEVSLDGVVLGNADFYAAVGANASVVYTKADAAFGRHRVKLRVTGTKNAASTDYYVCADAIEVMR